MTSVKRRILCAESNRDVGELIARMLENKGYEVEAVQTAAECVRLARGGGFDLYILNDSYIDADSIQLCQQLRALDPAIPVLLFSLDSSGQDRQKPLTPGVQLYVSKTSDFVALVQTIDRLLQPR
jgi:DNA-binding response OmpR family regulator